MTARDPVQSAHLCSNGLARMFTEVTYVFVSTETDGDYVYATHPRCVYYVPGLRRSVREVGWRGANCFKGVEYGNTTESDGSGTIKVSTD